MGIPTIGRLHQFFMKDKYHCQLYFGYLALIVLLADLCNIRVLLYVLAHRKKLAQQGSQSISVQVTIHLRSIRYCLFSKGSRSVQFIHWIVSPIDNCHYHFRVDDSLYASLLVWSVHSAIHYSTNDFCRHNHSQLAVNHHEYSFIPFNPSEPPRLCYLHSSIPNWNGTKSATSQGDENRISTRIDLPRSNKVSHNPGKNNSLWTTERLNG